MSPHEQLQPGPASVGKHTSKLKVGTLSAFITCLLDTGLL